MPEPEKKKRGRPKKKRPRNRMIGVRFTEDEHAGITRLADAEHRTPAGWLQALALQRLEERE